MKAKYPSKKREAILHTAENLFPRFGARRVSVEEICRKAGVSKMTFYKYFANKADLVLAIRDRWVREGFETFDEINARDIPFPEKINLMTHWKVEFASRINSDFIREMVTTEDALGEVKRRYLKNIARARETGEIRDDIDPEFIWMITEKLYELIRDEKWKTVFSDLGEFQRQMRTLIFFGLLTRSASDPL